MPSKGQMERNLRRLHHHVDPKHPRGQHDVISKGKGKGSDIHDDLEQQEAHDRRAQEEEQQRQQAEQMRQQAAQFYPQGQGPGFDDFDFTDYAGTDQEFAEALPDERIVDADEGGDRIAEHEEVLSGYGYIENVGHRYQHSPLTGLSLRERNTVDVQKAWERGRLGFMANLQDVVGQQVLSIDMPERAARAWQLTMVGHRYVGPAQGVAVTSLSDGPPSTTQLPFDNETQGGIKFGIEWGVSGGLERAIIDYPWAGVTISLVAASIRVFFPARTSFGAQLFPQVGGFLTPKGSFQNMDTQNQPTNTVPGVLVPAAPTVPGVVLVTVPTRARAYRYYTAGDQGASVDTQVIIVEQCTARAGVIAAVTLDNSPGGTSSPGLAFTQRQLAIPLNPNAQVIRFTNPVPNVAQTISVEFLLDMG